MPRILLIRKAERFMIILVIESSSQGTEGICT